MDPVNDVNVNWNNPVVLTQDDQGDNEWAYLVETLKEERNKILSIIK